MSKKRNKSNSLIEAEPDVLNHTDVTAKTFSDADTFSGTDTVIVNIPAVDKPAVRVEVPVSDYTQIVAAAVIEPMLSDVPFNPMGCTAQELAENRQCQMDGKN